MSISAASSSYVSSAAETDDDQSFSDMQVSQLQAEILQQSKDIEAFIKNSRKDDDSASLTVLKSLFVLFKSELSVNLKLRKLLVDERKKKSQCEVELKSFFHAVHKIGYQNINDLSTIVECLNEQDNQITNLLKSARQLKEEKANSKKLILQISEMQKQQTVQLQSDNDKDKQMKMIEQELDMCKKNIEVLNMEVNEKTNKLRILEKNNQQLINENLYMKKMFEQDKVSKQNQNDETKTFFMNQIQTLQKNIQTLSNTLKQKEIEHQKALTELNAQNLIDIQSVKTEMNNTISSINREKEDLEGRNPLHYSCEIDNTAATEIILQKLKDDDVIKQKILNKRDKNGKTPLLSSCMYQSDKCFNMIYHATDNPPDINDHELLFGNTPLHFASEGNNFYLFKSVMEKNDVEINKQNKAVFLVISVV